jgi:hypothetical protein
VTPFRLGGRCGNPLYTVLYIPGKTLGPAWSGQQRRFDGIFLLEGAAWYGALRNTWTVVEKTDGAMIVGHHCFVTSPLLSFLFLGHVFAVAPAFFWFRTIVSVAVWLLYLYSGAKACFV